jgi:DNA polymerase III, delta subunit
MDAARTRGQPAALAAAAAMIASGPPHAILLVGPPSVGKTTLALDIAAALLCMAAPPADRPCRECRGCRMAESGNHPDLHRVVPDGPGGQIRIGERSNPDPGTVRGLIAALALLPVEGGARVALIEHADRMNEDAQSALLKTLEEPPGGVTIILAADEEELLLPTVRSRCARIRLGLVGVRDVEAILAELGVADPPTAARLGRLAGGRPGVALAYALNPPAVVSRAEVARTLLDLLRAPRQKRLSAIREALAAAGEAGSTLAGARPVGAAAPPETGRGRRRGSPAQAREPSNASPDSGSAEAGDGDDTGRRLAPAERRRAMTTLLEIWRDVARDLRLVQLGEAGSIRDPGLLDDLVAAGGDVSATELVGFMDRLTRAGELLVSNVSPELIADALVLAWPQAARHAVAVGPGRPDQS